MRFLFSIFTRFELKKIIKYTLLKIDTSILLLAAALMSKLKTKYLYTIN